MQTLSRCHIGVRADRQFGIAQPALQSRIVVTHRGVVQEHIRHESNCRTSEHIIHISSFTVKATLEKTICHTIIIHTCVELDCSYFGALYRVVSPLAKRSAVSVYFADFLWAGQSHLSNSTRSTKRP